MADVTVVVPFYRCAQYVREAVQSVLAQTYRDFVVVVVNDGDRETPPWPALADISDPRLIRHDLPVNRGCFFACEVVTRACTTPYLALVDADDWVEPTWLQSLHQMAEHLGSDLAFTAHTNHKPDGGHVREFRDRELDDGFRHRVGLTGLHRVETLRQLGGWYAGDRLTYDTCLGNWYLMCGRVDYQEEPAAYHRRIVPGSLTQSTETGHGSEVRKESKARSAELYRLVWAEYEAGLRDEDLAQHIRNVVWRGNEHMHREAARLHKVLRRQP